MAYVISSDCVNSGAPFRCAAVFPFYCHLNRQFHYKVSSKNRPTLSMASLAFFMGNI